MPLLGHRAKVILLAGGRGERFWPKSTKLLPKQFLQVDGHKSLLRKTYERVVSIVDERSIFVVTGTAYETITRRELPELPEENLILEPCERNTAPALGIAALWLQRLQPDAIMIALPSDHHIVGEAKFHATLVTAVERAEEGELVTIGVRPTRPETGYGYIRTGPLLRHVAGLPVHQATAFTEKPNLETAGRYMRSGDYLWNAGILVCQAVTLRSEIAQHLSGVHSILLKLDEASPSLIDLRAQIATRFGEMPSISLDYGILERSTRVVTVPAHFGWNDIGDWAAMGRLLPIDDDGNAVRGEALVRDSHGLIVDGSASRLVVALGVNDLIIVDTPLAVLICARGKAQEVKSVTGLASAFMDALGRSQLPEGRVVPTPWGREIWWAVTDQYVGKMVEVRAGHSLGTEQSRQKHQTIYALTGTGRLRLGEGWHTIRPGSVFVIPPDTVHLVEAESDLTLIEVSTPESES